MSGFPREVRVYADWAGLNGPRLMGHLSMDRVRGKEVFSFQYDGGWLSGGLAQQLDPELQLTDDLTAISREILARGIDGIARKDLLAVLASPEACAALHRDLWLSDSAALAPAWQHLLAAYSSTNFPGLVWRSGGRVSTADGTA